MKQKIIFVLPQLKTGGGLRVIVELSNILIKDFSVHFVLPNSKDDCSFFIDKQINIEKIGKYSTGKLEKIKNILQMFKFLKTSYPNEIIITTDPIISLGFIFYRFKNLFRYVQADDYRIFDDLLLLKNKLLLTIYKLLTKFSYKQKITYIFNSNYTYEKFIEARGSKVPKRIVHPSIDADVFYEKNLEQNNQGLNLCLVGRKHPWKGFIDFIEVWNEIKKVPEIREKINNISVITHDDLSQFDLNEFTVFYPNSDKEIAKIYNKSDIFISTSWWEGFGLPPLEAMNCKCALLVSDSGGVNEYAYPEYNCLMYEPKNRTDLKRQLIKLIFDADLINILQINGKNISSSFTWEKSTQQFVEQIKSVVG